MYCVATITYEQVDLHKLPRRALCHFDRKEKSFISRRFKIHHCVRKNVPGWFYKSLQRFASCVFMSSCCTAFCIKRHRGHSLRCVAMGCAGKTSCRFINTKPKTAVRMSPNQSRTRYRTGADDLPREGEVPECSIWTIASQTGRWRGYVLWKSFSRSLRE